MNVWFSDLQYGSGVEGGGTQRGGVRGEGSLERDPIVEYLMYYSLCHVFISTGAPLGHLALVRVKVHAGQVAPEVAGTVSGGNLLGVHHHRVTLIGGEGRRGVM